MVVWHLMLDGIRKARSLIVVKPRAAVMHMIQLQDTLWDRSVRENLGNVDSVEVFQTFIIEPQSDRIAQGFMMAGDLHTSEIGKAVPFATNEVCINHRYLHCIPRCIYRSGHHAAR